MYIPVDSCQLELFYDNPVPPGRWNSLTPITSDERVSVIGSDLFEYDDYINRYLPDNPDLPLNSVIKIVFSYCITPRLIAEMEEFKVHIKASNFFMFEEIFGNLEKGRKHS